MSNEEQSSFMDQSAISQKVLEIKHQNCTASLESSKYPESVKNPYRVLEGIHSEHCLNLICKSFDFISYQSLYHSQIQLCEEHHGVRDGKWHKNNHIKNLLHLKKKFAMLD